MAVSAFMIFALFAVSYVSAHNPCLNHGFDGEVEMVPHESDCNYFYQCSNGDTYLHKCPENLEFNPLKNACDWPESAGCSGTGSNVPLPHVPCKNIPEPVCPPHEINKPRVQLPHPKDCRKFYSCDWGQLIEQDCGVGTHFSIPMNVCDWTWRAQCAC